MFTGIIKELGMVRKIARYGDIHRLEIGSKDIFKSVDIGGSVAVNGVCLTAVAKDKNTLSFDVMKETLKRSTLGALKEKDAVNLENSLKVGDPLDGHFVLGHIDCVGRIEKIRRCGDDVTITISIPDEFGLFVVEKGSVALDGISLTVVDVKAGSFSVSIIPHTLNETTLGGKNAGDKVNIEFDVIGKYIIKNEAGREDSRITENFLKSKGFE